jgi:hypothetical protein
MSDYLVTPIKGCWKNWQRLAKRARVSFSRENLELAETLFGCKYNPFPVARPKVVYVRERYSPSVPSNESIGPDALPDVHPVILLTLMAGIGDEEKTKHGRWTYRTIASTFFLVHPDGEAFTFLIDGGWERQLSWQARFIPSGKSIDRSMYIYGYKGNSGFARDSFFMPDENGYYGPCVTCF